MLKIFLYSMLAISFISGCNNGKETSISKKQKVTDDFDYEQYLQEIRNNKIVYQKAMSEKGIKLTINGPCDEALGDTLHERSKAYFDTVKIEDEIVVTFKFIGTCCQEFLADYRIKDDTMIIDLKVVNEEICACLCWYRYKFQVKNSNLNIAHIKINDV